MASTEIERRITLSEAEIEYRDAGDGEKRPTIVGYASVFNSPSRNLGGFIETVHPNAFDEVLASKPDVLGLYNHDKNKLLARSGNGSLKLSTDSYGLRYEMSLPATRDAEDVATMVKERLVTGSSFAFAVKGQGKGDEWRTDDRGMKRREIRSVALLEDVGPVVRPAYDASSVVVSRRAIEMALGENYRPNQTMANAARRGLRIAEKRDDVDTRLLVIAERMVNRDVLSVEEVAYLAEIHTRCAEARAANWTFTAAHAEWLLAGGDSGQKWVERRNETSAAADAGSDSATGDEKRDDMEDEATGTLSASNQALYGATEGIVEAHGKWPRGGPAGAHYIEVSPFGERGIKCSNCLFFEGGGACEVVQGSISEDGICKLWVIPEEKMSEESKRSAAVAEEKPAEAAPPKEETPPAAASSEETTPPTAPVVDESLVAQIKLAELNAVLLRTRLQASQS
jgi:HK97 family phage prohead protease